MVVFTAELHPGEKSGVIFVPVTEMGSEMGPIPCCGTSTKTGLGDSATISNILWHILWQEWLFTIHFLSGRLVIRTLSYVLSTVSWFWVSGL